MKPKLLAYIGFGAVLMFFIAYITGSVVNAPPAYDHLRDNVFAMVDPDLHSNYLVIAPLAAFFSGLCFLAVGLFIFFPKKAIMRAGASMLFLCGMVGSGIIFFFPADRSGENPGNMGLYHLLLSALLMIFLTITILLLGRGFGWYRRINRLKNPSMIIALLIIACDGIAQTGWSQAAQIGGIFNRLAWICLLVWMILVSRALYRLENVELL